jgi:hypothetical protein
VSTLRSTPPTCCPTDSGNTVAAHSKAARNLVGACVAGDVRRLVLLTIAGIDRPEFDDFSHYVAKRLQREIVLHSRVPTTIVKSTQWHEFAANPAAVTFSPTEVVVQDWLIQPIAADSVAEVLVVAATGTQSVPRTITGPDVIRLPDLTSKLLDAQGDQRHVRTADPPLDALADGALLAPDHAVAIGPTVDTWLETIKALACPPNHSTRESERNLVAEYTLPKLDYDYGALEPHISGQINELHHSKHHATYVKGANDALAKLEEARQRRPRLDLAQREELGLQLRWACEPHHLVEEPVPQRR